MTDSKRPPSTAVVQPSTSSSHTPHANGLSNPSISFPPPSSTNGSAGHASSGPQSSQARLLPAQSTQSSMQRQSVDPHPTQLGMNGSGNDWGVASAVNGMMLSKMPGANQEAIMKQLQALQSAKARRTSGTLPPGVRPNSTSHPISAPSPASITAPSPATASTSLPLDQQNAVAGPSRSPSAFPHNPLAPTQSPVARPPLSNSNGAPMSSNGTGNQDQFHQQRDMGSAQQVRPPAQTGAVRPPNRPGPADQRRQFLSSLAGYHKQMNLPLPTPIFNGEREGALKLGDVWLDVMEFFMAILRSGGITNISKMPPEGPFWQTLLTAKNIPNPLPQPIPLPRPLSIDVSLPQEMTTNPIQYLLAAYGSWLGPFEQHMQKQRMALLQRQQAAAALMAGRSPLENPIPAQNDSSPATFPQSQQPQQGHPHSAIQQAPTPGSAVATPVNVIAHPSPATSTIGVSLPDGSSPAPSKIKGDNPKHVPPPIKIDTSTNSRSPAGPTSGSAKKRKREKDSAKANKSKSGSVPATPTPQATPAPAPVPDPSPPCPPTPKRARYKVEYRPLHFPQPTLAGWDERAIVSSFPKHNLHQTPRSVHELGIVDMEAVLMSLRSRLPHQLGYALAVMSMLSMPHPDEGIAGLPLLHLQEIYVEIVDLCCEAAFGEDGYDTWCKSVGDEESRYEDLTYSELERMGRDKEWGFDTGRCSTGGRTDIILCCLNLLRNLSMMVENQEVMARYPGIFDLLARITDSRLCRFYSSNYASASVQRDKPIPLQLGRLLQQDMSTSKDKFESSRHLNGNDLYSTDKPVQTCDADEGTEQKDSKSSHSSNNRPSDRSSRPFSILELARVRREVISILSNLSLSFYLPSLSFSSTKTIFKLLSSSLPKTLDPTTLHNPLYGPPIPLSVVPPSMTPSTYKTLEALCKLTHRDSNREILSRLPSNELISLFETLIKLLPISRRQEESLKYHEDFIAHFETLSLCLYSIAFLSPLSVRAKMREIKGVIPILLRVISFTGNTRGTTDWRNNPLGILCRRLVETLSVLNGTVSPAFNEEKMGFGAGGVDGKGWKFASRPVESGWLAGHGDELDWVVGVKGVDGVVLSELEGLWME
ncbi:hypothetical protein TREMEDRAFT_61215 [Tremella mesenterica DSM 1558]|uniref:uncharacterized protein n=1 Tax=Tremella mesenterica (strain ATCC 24925 / CBS 8224 / DSM 1558 / NBRC 9311 / NRRL Y-6157 / RJB 2259-6 / UBC 559-6) TaxID=578456 RepID=UPI0003F4A62E|nr:uncharacterized protein TREMEDRAFT_61215 [Tremella mesenterica DSM 1558]EIW70704.1 hypothetical protein TREMEDRAFT_61215 [Tremella mesenterica DSM 1558]